MAHGTQSGTVASLFTALGEGGVGFGASQFLVSWNAVSDDWNVGGAGVPPIRNNWNSLDDVWNEAGLGAGRAGVRAGLMRVDWNRRRRVRHGGGVGKVCGRFGKD